MEPEAVEALRRRSERRMLVFHWIILMGLAGMVFLQAYREGSFLELVALVPVVALALLGPGRAVRAPDFWFRRGALIAWVLLMACFNKSWPILILVPAMLLDGFRSWRNLDVRRTESG